MPRYLLLLLIWTAYGFTPSNPSCDATSLQLQKRLDQATAEVQAANAAERERLAVVLGAFAGIWVGDGGEALHAAPDCTIMLRVNAQTSSVTRGIFCAGGILETATAPVLRLSTEESRFAGAFQFTTQLGAAVSSCRSDQRSRFAGLEPIAFDLKTAIGGEAASFAYTKLGGQLLVFHNGASLDELNRSKDCGTLIRLSQEASDTPEAKMLKQAAMLCQSEQQTLGCQTGA